MFSSLLIALAGLASLSGTLAQDAWHLDDLTPLVTERLDPVVSPNRVASHMHAVVGGSKFGASYNYAEQIQSKCTTAGVSADKSNYWMPKLYWINNDTTFSPLYARPRFYYHLGRGSPAQPIIPFPEGLRMLAGDPNAKSPTGIASFTCIINSDLSTGSIVQDHFNFNRNCPYGIRVDIFFPQCWDGINLYKSDQSHMAYPVDMAQIKTIIMLEYSFWTESWAPGKATAGKLAWANGDTTGFGVHADFVNGWDTSVLAAALNSSSCIGKGSMPLRQCPVFAPMYTTNPQCSPEKGVMVEPSGATIDMVPVSALPGCNPLWSTGPKPTCATAPPAPDVGPFTGTDGAYVATGDQVKAVPLPTTPGWANVGCIRDFWSGMLTGSQRTYYDSALEPKSCTAICSKQGYSWALMGQGADTRYDCTCGEGISPTAAVYPGMCTQPCPGNSSATCGAYAVHSVWYAPPGTTVNSTVPAAAGDPSYIGCYYNYGSTSLGTKAASTYNDPALTTAGCLQTCASRNATWAATTNGKTCVCGNDYDLGSGWLVADSQCSFTCTGNSKENCGWTYGYSLYNVTASKYAAEAQQPVSLGDGWKGCFNDPGSVGLNSFSWTSNSMTPDSCTYGCAELGYPLAGLTQGNRCKCGTTWGGGALYPPSTCNWNCTGNSSITCGGNYLSSVYDTSFALKKVTADIAARPAGWKGCYWNGNGGLFKDWYGYDGSLTVERCMATCSTYGYTWGAVANQWYCRCTSTDPTNVSTNPRQPSNVYCTTKCPGSSKETCGAPGQYLEAYNISANAAAANATTTPGWVGCFSGSTGISGPTWTQGDMTVDDCATGCLGMNYTMSALYGNRCTCGSAWDTSKGKQQPDFQCNTPCPGNSTQACGGYQLTSVWKSSIGRVQPIVSTPGYLGCWQDNPNNRTLKAYSYSSAGMSNANCVSTCRTQGYAMAATNGNNCWCGNSIQGGWGSYTSSELCSTSCPGDNNFKCGGPNNLVSMWNVAQATTKVANGGNSTTPATNSTSSGAQSVGCYTDVGTLGNNAYSSSYMTVDQCIYYCKGLGNTYAGLTNGNTCRCGNSAPVAITLRSQCSTRCISNSSQTCGGSGVIEYYPVTASTNFVDPYKAVAGDMGCYQEGSGNVLNNKTSFASYSLTNPSCSANCAARGYGFSATKGSVCYCGTSIAPWYQRQAATACYTACPGDSSTTCGGYQVVTVRSSLSLAGASSTNTGSGNNATSTASRPEGNLGCFLPGTLFSKATAITNQNDASPSICRRYCRLNGFNAAALTQGSYCYCGSQSQLGEQVPDSACTVRCKGDNSLFCGDSSVATVYDTTGPGARGLAGYPANYVGCFADGNSNLLNSFSFTNGASMTSDVCRRACIGQGYTIYGTAMNARCSCSGKQPLYGLVADGNCGIPCPGNKTEMCGGNYKMSVYNPAFASDSFNPAVAAPVPSASASASLNATVSGASTSKAASATPLASTSKASSAAASPSKASSVAASPSKAVSSAAASPSKVASSAAASPSKVASSAAASPSKAASSAAASPSKAASSAAASPSKVVSSAAASSIGGGLAASPPTSSAAASPSKASSAAASPSKASSASAVASTSQASSAAASPSKVASSAVQSSATSTSPAVTAPAPNPTNHLGCYKQNTAVPSLNKALIDCATLTPGMCKLWCNANNYQYAGMTNSTHCGCSNDISSVTLVTASNCNAKCFNDLTVTCGDATNTHYDVWKSSALVAKRNHRRRMRQVHGSKRTDEAPMAFNNEEEILDYLRRQQMMT